MKENKAQYEAIRHFTGPARVLAGPGAGKTYVLVNRIMHLINECNVPADKILVITFTKAAALEMRERFNKLTKGPILPVHFHTFHSLFYFFLKQSHVYSDFSVVSNQEKFQTVSHIKNTIKTKFPTEPYVSNEYLITLISYALNEGDDDREESILSKECVSYAVKEYKQLITREHKLDFDDFATKTNEVFDKYPGLLKKLQSNYEFILIDEFQDINSAQYKAIKRLAAPHGNIFAVGDDDQAIYGFRGARPSIMRDFLSDFPDSKEILLATNYRCSSEILHFALDCIKENKDRVSKELMAERGELNPVRIIPCKDKAFQNKKIVDLIKMHIDRTSSDGNHKLSLYDGTPKLSDIAIICRTNNMLDIYAMVLKKAGIPFYYRERRKTGLFDNAISKDVLAYFAIASGKAGRKDYLRILGKGALDVVRGIFASESVDMASIIAKNRSDFVLCEELNSFERKMKLLSKMDASSGLNYIMKGLHYENYLVGKRLRNPESEVEDERVLESLETFAADYDNLTGFMRFASEYEAFEKESFENEGNREIVTSENKVNLLTMHGSKGLEFPVVILPDLNDGKMPHTRSGNMILLEEERRLFYVAMTRARDELYLTLVGAPDDYRNRPSRFLPTRLVEKAMAKTYPQGILGEGNG